MLKDFVGAIRGPELFGNNRALGSAWPGVYVPGESVTQCGEFSIRIPVNRLEGLRDGLQDAFSDLFWNRMSVFVHVQRDRNVDHGRAVGGFPAQVIADGEITERRHVPHRRTGWRGSTNQ